MPLWSRWQLILQRVINYCMRLPAELDEDVRNSNHPLCSSTKIERRCPRDILVELHKTLVQKKVFCAVHQKVTIATRWNGYPCPHKKIERKQLLVNKQDTKHSRNEKKHLHYLHGNRARTVEILKQQHCFILPEALPSIMTFVKYGISLMVALLVYQIQ